MSIRRAEISYPPRQIPVWTPEQWLTKLDCPPCNCPVASPALLIAGLLGAVLIVLLLVKGNR